TRFWTRRLLAGAACLALLLAPVAVHADENTQGPPEPTLAQLDEPEGYDDAQLDAYEPAPQAEPAVNRRTPKPVVVATDVPDKAVVAEDFASDSKVEVIRERYPNRTVKIEREVTQDADGNYVNHGTWKMWDEAGNLVAEGRYFNGQREGIW